MSTDSMRDPMKQMTRREMFAQLCSRDAAKSIYRAWSGFAGEYARATTPDRESLSKEERERSIREAISKFGKHKRKCLEKNTRS